VILKGFKPLKGKCTSKVPLSYDHDTVMSGASDETVDEPVFLDDPRWLELQAATPSAWSTLPDVADLIPAMAFTELLEFLRSGLSSDARSLEVMDAITDHPGVLEAFPEPECGQLLVMHTSVLKRSKTLKYPVSERLHQLSDELALIRGQGRYDEATFRRLWPRFCAAAGPTFDTKSAIVNDTPDEWFEAWRRDNPS
jgi:hypothetical protein